MYFFFIVWWWPLLYEVEILQNEKQIFTKLDIACLTIKELSLIGHNNKNFDHDESEDENDKEWVAPYEERNAFNHNLIKLRIEVCFVT